jgi:hypothetical protein
MLNTIVQAFATFGSLLVSLCVIGAGMVATAFAIGHFAENFGYYFTKATPDQSVTFGLKSGALIGFVFSVAAIYQLGNWGALLSLIGLFVSLLLLTGVVYLIGDSRTPLPTYED